jgi:two-component system sensor histidine kinase/response regulator
MPLPSQSDSPSSPPAAPERQRTLLVVDDEEGPRRSIRAVFKSDYNVLLAENGAQALELARANRLDAAVLDIRMTDMSGIEVLEQLKKIDPAIEVIMLTAYETTETARQALRLGASDYLDKPFDVATIRAAVANAMNRRMLSEEIHHNNHRLQELQTEVHKHKLLEEMARAKGDIYASIIHDLNSPLAVIGGFVELINNKIGDVDHQEMPAVRQIRDHLAHITRQINKSIEVSQRYLSFLRQRSVHHSGVSVAQILGELEDLMRVHPDLKNHQITVHRRPVDAQVAINGIDLIQILMNLCSNALQCTDQPHKVEVRWHYLNPPHDLTALRDDAENRVIYRDTLDTRGPLVTFEVSDDGPGIPPDVVPHIFDSYFSTKSTGRGTGLGLAIVLRFVKEAGGAVRLRTSSGRGTTFTVYLPAM